MFKYMCENRNLSINASFLVTVTSLKYVLKCILYKYNSKCTNENVTQSRCSQICTNLINKLLFLSDRGAPHYISLLFCFMYTFECLMINSTLKSTEGEKSFYNLSLPHKPEIVLYYSKILLYISTYYANVKVLYNYFFLFANLVVL